jgi:hypothetical protein
MYCVSDKDYLKDFNMLLNDNIIDCFLDESDKKEAESAKPGEFEKMVAEVIAQSQRMQLNEKPLKKPKKLKR